VWSKLWCTAVLRPPHETRPPRVRILRSVAVSVCRFTACLSVRVRNHVGLWFVRSASSERFHRIDSFERLYGIKLIRPRQCSRPRDGQCIATQPTCNIAASFPFPSQLDGNELERVERPLLSRDTLHGLPLSSRSIFPWLRLP